MEPDPDEHQHPGEEELDWDNESIKSNKPKGLYSKTSETARGLISTERQCALFCGGKKCKYCSGEGWAENETVIKGLYSQWVTDNILAMARPSNECIKKHQLVQQFVDAGINSIINLQIAGEHADCGPHKLDPSGFLYSPQSFMEEGIFFYNFGWPDYGVASLSTILDMVKVMQFAVSQGKVAVHCHAGRGRTGVIIACYLVFTNRISGREAIHYVREKRPNSIQTRQQMQVIEEFELYLQPFRTVYASRGMKGILFLHTRPGFPTFLPMLETLLKPPVNHHGTERQKGSHEFSLQQFLNRQRHILHGYEARRLKHIPKIIYTVCERLLELAKKGSSLRRHLEKDSSEQRMANLKPTFSTMSQTSDRSDSATPINKTSSKESFMVNGKKRYKRSLASVRNFNKSISLEDLANDKFKSVMDNAEKMSSGSSNSGIMSKTPGASDEEEDDDDSIVFGNSTVDLKAAVNSSSKDWNTGVKMRMNGNMDATMSETSSISGTVDWSIDQSATGDLPEDHVQTVGYALSSDKIESYMTDRALQLENDLNQSDTAWTQLATEGDPHVLGLLLWDWLDQLKEPVLRAQDLLILVNWIEEPTVGLQKVEKGTRHTIEYIIKVISKLKPLKEQTVINLYEKLLSYFTQQWVTYDSSDVDQSWASTTKELQHEKDHWTLMKPSDAQRLFQFFHNLHYHFANRHGHVMKTQ